MTPSPLLLSLAVLFVLALAPTLPLKAQDLPQQQSEPTPAPAPAETPAAPAPAETTPPAESTAAPSSAPDTTPAPTVTPTPQVTPSPTSPPATATTPTPEDNPAPSDEFSQKVLPAEKPRKPIPTSSGDKSGTVWVGHRAVIDRYAGWGWVKKEKEPWSRARWVAMEETIGKSVAPGRHYSRPTQDDGMTYRLYGEFAEYKGYEPNYDVFVDVFRIRGWETVGRETRPNLRPPRGSAGGPPRWSERGANLPR